MPTVRIGSITEGLTLSSDVKDLNGRLLLRQGVCLQERHIQLFKSWGVTEVEVISLPNEPSAPVNLSPEEQQSRLIKSSSEIALKEVFLRNDLTHPMMKELFEICLARKAKLPW